MDSRTAMKDSAEEFIPTRQSLLLRLKDWADESSWRDFFETYWKLIYGVARKAGLSDAEAQDVVQETIISVAKQMPGFNYDPSLGTFKAWLMQATRRRIIDQFRKGQYQRGDKRFPREQALGSAIIERQPDLSSFNLENLWDEEWKKNLLETALEKVKRQANPRQYQMFDLHVVRRIPARKVAQRLGAKLPEVYFAKYKISAALKKEIRLLESKMI